MAQPFHHCSTNPLARLLQPMLTHPQHVWQAMARRRQVFFITKALYPRHRSMVLQDIKGIR